MQDELPEEVYREVKALLIPGKAMLCTIKSDKTGKWYAVIVFADGDISWKEAATELEAQEHFLQGKQILEESGYEDTNKVLN